MIWIKPDYYDRFACIGSACSATCCASWEIEVDDETAEKYAELPGPLGDRIREKLVVSPGENYFSLENGRCPFLNREGLCDIIREFGEDALCDICREHPRFYNWYGNVTEAGLGLCCEAAARLILENPEKMKLVVTEVPDEEDEMNLNTGDEGSLLKVIAENADGEAGKEGSAQEASGRRAGGIIFGPEGLKDPMTMQINREAAFYILQDRSYTVSRRLQHFLEFGCRLQEVPNMEPDMRNRRNTWLILIRLFRSMETCDDSWGEQLERLEENLDEVIERQKDFWLYIRDRDYEYEHLAVYLTYRYFPQSLYDGKILNKFMFVVCSVLLMYLLDTLRYMDTGEYTIEDRNVFSRNFSREVEYCPENLELFEGFCDEQGSRFLAGLEGIIWEVRS